MENSEVMGTAHRYLLGLATVILLAFLPGCASSGPSTSQAPPETPEDKPAATGAMEGEQGEAGGGGGAQSGAGEGGGAQVVLVV